MIGYLRGEILEHSEGRMLVLVSGGTAGVGYSVQVPQGPAYLDLLPGKTVELYIHTHVREDALDLYGFASRVEKELFLTLIGVNGIGPKVGLSILSSIEPGSLIQAILEEDKDSLTRIPGIGKKTAERVVLELGDKIRKKMESGAFAGTIAQPGAGASAALSRKAAAVAASGPSRVVEDAKAALVGLGYREQDVASLLNRVLAEFETPPRQAEELVRTALRQLI